MNALHSRPNKKRLPEEFGETYGSFGGDRFSFCQNVVKMLSGDANHPRNFGLRLALWVVPSGQDLRPADLELAGRRGGTVQGR